ncbi:MAG: hypothetical protein R3343_11475 [Nitriliruptorales bacterium]|nr:hypothetical protein [Nitriliruptorales bacterium]
MARPRYKPVTPDQKIRELRKEFKAIRKEKEEPGPERAKKLASFVREAHLERQLNMSMHAGNLCLEEDPDPPSLLIGAYLPDDLDDPEDRLRALADLQELSRYLDSSELESFTEDAIDKEAKQWVKEADDAAERHRIRRLASIFDREFADNIRDEMRFLG